MIISSYTENNITYSLDDYNTMLSHSYQNHPQGYSAPQIIYNFSYSGMLKNTQWDKDYTWTIDPPFYILSGQSTSNISCELIPKLSKENEKLVKDFRKNTHKDYKYSNINLQISKWKESLNLYYKQGPLWKIDGNKSVKINSVETYTLIPQYDQTGQPPKNSTNPDSYSFDIKNGTVVKFYGTNPPYGNPKIDVLWYSSGSSYLSFYSSWTDDNLKFPNTIGILVS